MSFKNTPIPPAAQAAGMTNLVFADDFDSYDTIDLSGEGKPGYNWYTDRPYKFPTLTKEELTLADSVLFMKPISCSSAIGLGTFSKKGNTGFTMHYGYAEARIRAKMSTGKYDGVPAFWGIGKRDFVADDLFAWTDCGELDILEINIEKNDKGEDDMIYTGTTHHHHRNHAERRPNGAPVQTICTNLVNALGYKKRDFVDEEWHTYAALWEKGHISWYMDNKLMHSARYTADALPEYFYRDDPTPLPRLEETASWAVGRTWVGGHTVMDEEEEVIILGCNFNWPMEVDWVRIWQKED